MRHRRAQVASAVLVIVAVVGVGLVALRPWDPDPPACAATAATEHPDWSVARRWDEALLGAIRRALPNPPVHARNLYHLSAAMWDAWAAYDPTADGVFVHEKHTTPNVEAARNEAISYAAYRVLASRFIKAVGGEESLSAFADVMDSLCYDLAVETTEGGSPAALGNRIAKVILDTALGDGSNQADGYAAPDYAPANPPLVVTGNGSITMTDPNRWQPLQLERMISQNGIPIENGVQQHIGPHWGHVTSFALPPTGEDGVAIDLGGPPRFGTATEGEYKAQALEVIRYSSYLDAADGETIDISPGALGGNSLGTNDGRGHPVNPATGRPYAPNVVKRGDFARSLTEFWADGPKSETPPGHWNVVANDVSDALDPDLRIEGTGEVVDRLEWDVKLYLALNGAVHDAAIAAWGLKGHYDSVRPISMIRYLASLGQSSDPALLEYDAHGIPLEDGLVELITEGTTATGGRHDHLAGHEGEIAIRAWQGNPEDPATGTSGVGWILAAEWVPYQLPTFVTPSFAGYTSGHSTFSRAAAEVLTAYTGSEFFPGGLSSYTKEPGDLTVEVGPTEAVELQWATYYDAADQAGISRLFGGIHVAADDFAGRRIGSQCGKEAWALAQHYYDGTAVE